MKQTQILLNTLKDSQDWIPSYKLMLKETKYGWLGKSDRLLRKLAENCKIERRLNGRYVEYRLLDHTPVFIKKDSNTVIQL